LVSGTAIKSANGNMYITGNAGSYTVSVTNANGCTGVSAPMVLTVNTLPVAAVITNSRPLSFCNGDSTVLTSSITTGIQWQLNNNNIIGATGSKITVKQSGNYTVVTTNSSSCATTSALATITNNPIPPSPSITISAATTICTGTKALITATAVNGGTSPQYQWYKNNIKVGSNSTSYIDSLLKKQDSVWVVITSNSACLVNNNSKSNVLIFNVNPLVSPSITITASTGNTICAGTSVVFTASPANGGSVPNYQWYKNNTVVGSGLTYTSTALANNDSVWAVIQANNTCQVNSTAKSNIYHFTVNALPVLSITGSACTGNALTLNSNQPLSQIVWQLNNKTLTTIKDSLLFSFNGVTVAGGNGYGVAANQLSYPYGVFVDRNGNIFIADIENNRIQKWAPGATSGVTVAGGNGAGSAANQLNYPYGVFVDNNGNIFIADYNNSRIQKWAPGATSGITVAGGNGAGSAANQLAFPSSVFVDGNGNIFIADQSNNRIQKWSLSATAGVTVAGGNKQGAAANQLNYPWGLFIDSIGNIFIADGGNNRIQKWAPGATTGSTVAGGNGQGAAANQFNYSLGVFVDIKGNIFIADNNNNRIQKWAPGAISGVTVAGGNGWGFAANQLAAPLGVFVDGYGNIFVADNGASKIEEFKVTTIDSISNTLQATSAGTYSAFVTAKTGCSATSPNDVVGLSGNGPTVTISANSTGAICPGTKVILTATITNAGNNPTYQWYKNNNNVGSNSPTYTDSSLNNKDSIWVKITGNQTCQINNTTKSNVLKMNVNSLPPVPIITSKGNTSFCQGLYDILSSSSTTGNQWKLNGTAIPKASTSQNFVANVAGNYTVTVSNAAGCSATSTATAITILPTPAKPVITEDANMNLVSSATKGNQWYSPELLTGDTGKVYTPWVNGNYYVQVTVGGCISPMSDVYVYNNPNLNKESLRITGTSTLDSKAVQLYPNPVGNTLKISYQIIGIQNVTAEIMDMNGNVIARKESVTSGSNIDVTGYASGMYIIRLVNGENKEILYTSKIIKIN